jgi:indole-3-glycerol phosphate synthase
MPGNPQPAEWLDRIVRAKRLELAESQRRVPLTHLEKRIERRQAGVFKSVLVERREGALDCAVIAELKKASPSRGVIRSDYDPPAIARSYERAGARAVSVLTDREFFQGSLNDLTAVEEAVVIPTLRKDFTLAEYHVYEAAAARADAVLLIVAILTADELTRLRELATELGMDALVEVHTEEELKIARDAGGEIIGVNNRNLKTFEISLTTSLELIDSIPDTVVAVSESGLRDAARLQQLREAGFDAFLIGESFMSAPDPGAALARLLSGVAHSPAVQN